MAHVKRAGGHTADLDKVGAGGTAETGENRGLSLLTRRLKALAKSRSTQLNRLIDEMTTLMLVEFDAETRFRIRAERGAGQEERGLELLKKARG